MDLRHTSGDPRGLGFKFLEHVHNRLFYLKMPNVEVNGKIFTIIKMNMLRASSPSPRGKVYDRVRFTIKSDEEAYMIVLSTRRLFGIPDDGFGTLEEVDQFEADTQEKTELQMVAWDTPDINTSEKSEQTIRERLYELPDIHLSRITKKLVKLLGFPDDLEYLVRFFILCENIKIDPYADHRFISPLVRLRQNLQHNYTLTFKFPLRNGLLVKVYGPLSNKELRNLKKEIEDHFIKYPTGIKKPTKGKKDVPEHLAILGAVHKGKTGYDLYDEVVTNSENKKDEKKDSRRIFKRVQRIKKT